MAQRPRSHVLETESRQAFEAAMPSRWVYRKHDYGLHFDGAVEVFTPDGNETGLMFFEQLKATDTADLKRALKINMPIKTCTTYY